MEDREKKAVKGLRVVQDALRVVKEEFQAARDELCTKAAVLDWACQEVSEGESSVERLAKECNGLRRDLQRQEAMVNHRDGVIAELRDEACTLWASGWLAFKFRATKAFLSLDFNFPVPDPDEEEAEESVSKDEVDPKVFSDTPSPAPLPGEAKVPAEAGSLLPSVRASSSNLHGLEACTVEVTYNPTSNI